MFSIKTITKLVMARKRNYPVTIWLDEKEMLLLKDKLSKTYLSRSDYIRKCSLGKNITVVSGIRELIIEIKSIVRKLAEKARIEFGSTTKLVIELSKRKIIDEKILPIFKDFWNIRNIIVHGSSEKVSENIIYELTYLGYRILTLLSLTKDSI